MKEIRKTNNIVIREPSKSRAESGKPKPMAPRNQDTRNSKRNQPKIELPFDIKR